MISMNDLRAFGNGVTTERLKSAAEKVVWSLQGHCADGAGVSCSLWTYDEAGAETLVYSQEVPAAADGSVRFDYSFDPISLAVYQKAVSFRVAVCPVTAGADLNLTAFSLTEEETGVQHDEAERICSIVTDAAGNRAVSVLQTDGSEVVVPLLPKKVLFVGNSILLGMHNAYGMCASAPDKDYFHYVSRAILEQSPDCTFLKLHGAGFEHAESLEMFENWYAKEPNAYTGQPPAIESFTEDLDLIILQLTDNVNNPAKVAAFPRNLDILLERIKTRCPRARLLWVHGWYQRSNETIYQKLLEACRRWRIERIDISDLRGKENEAYLGQKYLNPAGQWTEIKDLWVSHPGDRGMKAIAERILEALGIETIL